MTFVSLFSGIGGFDLGLERAGMKCAWQVEKDKHCRQVLAKHWPNTQRHDDVETFNAGEPVRWIVGGFPCQDLSVAGRRAGLAGRRSGLFHEFMRIIVELAPTGVLIENVPGLRSSWSNRTDPPSGVPGRKEQAGRPVVVDQSSDFYTVTRRLAELGYGWAYRSLDAQYFGLAQRRERVFIVGHLGGVRRAAEILFERESLPWDYQPRRKTRKDVACPIAGVSNGDGTRNSPDDAESLVISTHTHTGFKPRAESRGLL